MPTRTKPTGQHTTTRTREPILLGVLLDSFSPFTFLLLSKLD